MNKNPGHGVLHFVLYNRGHAGMCNILLSLQCALIIAKLTDRKHIVFYHESHIFNSAKHLLVFELFDVDFDYSIKPLAQYPANLHTLPGFSACCFFWRHAPDRSFRNGRQAVDLGGLSHLEQIGADADTLGYYSYQFHLETPVKDAVVDFIRDGITPKWKYLEDAQRISKALGEYQSIHLRRGDYLAVAGTRNGKVAWPEIMPNITAWLDRDVPVLIHSDEADEAHFRPLTAAGYTIRFFEKDIAAGFDDAEKGLISLLVATQASRFMGTMISTFTGVIHQYRRQHGDYSSFKYLYSQIDSVRVAHGEIRYGAFGVNSWNRLELSDGYKKTLFFAMEHQECYPDRDFAVPHALKIFPAFLGAEEVAYLAGIIGADAMADYDARQHRKRTCRQLDQDPVLTEIAARVMRHVGTSAVRFENNMQFFDHLAGGETFLHSDALCGDGGSPRLASVLLYLNDGYEGGYLDFPYLKTRISPSRGMMMYFPIVNRYGEQVDEFSHSAGVIIRGAKRMCYLSIIPAPATTT